MFSINISVPGQNKKLDTLIKVLYATSLTVGIIVTVAKAIK